MSKRHGAREQRKLAKEKSKRDARRRESARLSSPNPLIRLEHADRWPVVKSLVGQGLWSTGIGYAVIARRTPEGMIAVGVFLLDVYCLGVKDAFWKVATRDASDVILMQIAEKSPLKAVSPEHLCKLVHCAADYAQSLGLAPHPDFRKVRLLLAGLDPALCRDEFTFGKDGKPYYIAGPYDSPQRIRNVIELVTAAGGHYIVPVNPDELDVDDFDILEDDDDEE